MALPSNFIVAHPLKNHMNFFFDDLSPWQPHDRYDVCGIAYVRTDRKDNIFMQRQLYINEAHKVLNILRNAPPLQTFAVLVHIKTKIKMLSLSDLNSVKDKYAILEQRTI